jgi:hypothetical protein
MPWMFVEENGVSGRGLAVLDKRPYEAKIVTGEEDGPAGQGSPPNALDDGRGKAGRGTLRGPAPGESGPNVVESISRDHHLAFGDKAPIIDQALKLLGKYCVLLDKS